MAHGHTRGRAHWLAGAALWLGLALLQPAAAQGAPGPSPAEVSPADVSAADRAAIRGVIQSQIEAFRHDDAAGSFAFAAPGLRQLFNNDPAMFLHMVQQGYQPVYRPRSTVFGALEQDGGSVTQKLEVVGPDGAGHEALYSMEHEPDGSWRISGCVLTDSPAVGA